MGPLQRNGLAPIPRIPLLFPQNQKECKCAAQTQNSEFGFSLALSRSFAAFLQPRSVAFAPRITQYGLARSLFYTVLIVVGLMAAGFLFGALKSYGRYSGKVLSGTLELGGPAVVAVLIIVIGLFYASPTATFSLVVRPYGPHGKTDTFKTGTVTVTFGTSPQTQQIGSNGQVQFNEVPASFLGAVINVAAEVPGYVSSTTGPFKIPEEKILYISMAPEQPSSDFRGRFLDVDGRPVVSAYVEVNQGLASGRTDEHGDFSIRVPMKSGTIVHLWAELNGVSGYDDVVTIGGAPTLTFTPKKNIRRHRSQ